MRRFVGQNHFCAKMCFNDIKDPNYCLNTYDIIGCEFNMPSLFYTSSNLSTSFTSCDGDLQDVVGIYSVDGTS